MAATQQDSRQARSASATRPAGPPDERFWKRYSPHGEMPLSMAGSFAFHLLVLGGLVLGALYLSALLFRDARSIPVDPVRLDLGGGGGSKTGSGTGKGVGGGVEDVGPDKGGQASVDGADEKVTPRPALTPTEKADLNVKFDPETVRYINDTPTEGVKAFARLDEKFRRTLADGINPGAGKGGTGEGGGKGTGKGTGGGSGEGAGKANLSKREKRMLRWTMKFTANNGPDYVTQLNQLGAMLAIPVTEGPDPQYKIVKDLRKRPAVLEVEDLSQIKRIYWIDDKPNSVSDVMTTLGLSVRPSRFVAFMPEELEARLFKMEKEAMERQHGSYDEDRIFETIFRVIPGRGGVELVSLKVK